MEREKQHSSFFESVEKVGIIMMAFAANMAVTGISFYAFGVFFKPLAKSFGWSRQLVAWGPGVSLIISACYAPIVGRSADKLGMRPLLLGGSLVGALALSLMGYISHMWQYFLLFGVVLSLSNLHMGEIVTGSAVARRFPGRSGMALGFAAVGMSFGGVVMPPFAQLILDHWGLRGGFLAMGMSTLLLVFFPAVIFLRKKGNNSGEDEHSITIEKVPGRRSWTRSEALRSARFWKLVFVFVMGLFPIGPMLVQQVPFITDMGIHPLTAAWVLSLSAGMGMVGKIFWGTLFDRLEGRVVIGASLVMQAISVMWLLRATGLGDAILFAVFFGLGMGGLVPMNTAMRARQFGEGNLGAIMGISSTIIMLFQAGSQPFAGWIFDVTGTYRWAFKVFIACYLAGFLVVMTLRDPKEEEWGSSVKKFNQVN